VEEKGDEDILCDGEQIVSVDDLTDLGVLLVWAVPAGSKEHFPMDVSLFDDVRAHIETNKDRKKKLR
jgi:hypothetical protein